MPRLLRPLLASLLLVAPGAFADALYKVELIVFRQADQPVAASLPAPEDWAGSAASIPQGSERQPALEDAVAKLASNQGYQVLLHQAWQQPAGSATAPLRFSSGQARDGHFPVEGALGLTQDRQLELRFDTWVNQFDADGFLAGSERLSGKRRLIPGKLVYLDHPSIGALIRITAL